MTVIETGVNESRPPMPVIGEGLGYFIRDDIAKGNAVEVRPKRSPEELSAIERTEGHLAVDGARRDVKPELPPDSEN